MISQRIHKYDSAGRLRFWHYEVDGPRWRAMSGLVGSPPTVSGWTICEAKSQPTAEAQALFEAQAEEKKKLEREYSNDPNNVRRDGIGGCPIKPMLAHKYEGWTGPCYTQPKLDGIRCIATKDGLFSRQGKPIVAVPHIELHLVEFFHDHPGSFLDGELYNHDLRDNFNEITSIVKRQKVSDADLEKAKNLIQFHVYDHFHEDHPSKSFTERGRILDEEYEPEYFRGDKYVRFVPTYFAQIENDLDQHYQKFLEAGYEGQMIRHDLPYEQKRSKALLKRKEFQDAEFAVVAIEEGNGNWAGYAKRAVLRLKDGREFGAGIRGNQAEMKALLGTSPDSATVRYFALTPDGVPRFPVVTAFHEGERL